MLYKGGPQNYSKDDWKFVGGLIGITVFILVIANIFDPAPSRTAKSSSPAASSEFVDAAKEAGYSGSEAEQVAVAAERLCNSTGEC